MSCKRIPVVFDCDPGHDDAIALIWALASQQMEIRAVTTVAGNQTLDKVTHNALAVLTLMGCAEQIPVAQGYDQPLVASLNIGGEVVHGDSGLEGPVLPEVRVQPVSQHAVELMHEVIQKSEEKITVIALGPLTNVGAFLKRYPEDQDRIERIAIMGGGTIGNWTPAAEYNIWADPEAASIVFRSGIPILMAGLDVTQKAYVTREENERIRALGNPVAKFVAELIDFFSRYHYEVEGFPGCTLHDPTTIAALLYPQLFETKRVHVDVELAGSFTRGMTVVDLLDYYTKVLHQTVEKQTDFLVSVDRDAFVETLLEDLKRA